MAKNAKHGSSWPNVCKSCFSGSWEDMRTFAVSYVAAIQSGACHHDGPRVPNTSEYVRIIGSRSRYHFWTRFLELYPKLSGQKTKTGLVISEIDITCFACKRGGRLTTAKVVGVEVWNKLPTGWFYTADSVYACHSKCIRTLDG